MRDSMLTTADPEQQGLKHRATVDTSIVLLLTTADPEQQGLKLQPCLQGILALIRLTTADPEQQGLKHPGM